MNVLIGSRGSALALWQANHVRDALRSLHPDLAADVEVLHTTGDRITDVPLAMIGDKGLFTREVDDAVLDGRVHCAVHSFKDVPTRLPAGLTLAAVLEREDPRDAFVPGPGRPTRLGDLPPGSRIGTSSLRRRALLLSTCPDLIVEDMRGNLDTRLRKLEEGACDAIIVAYAGLRRLGREDVAGELLGAPEWLPAAAQGALAIVARTDDHPLLERLCPLDHPATRATTAAERAFLARLEGGCQIPIGVLGHVEEDRLSLRGLVAALDGSTIVRGDSEGAADAAAALGRALAVELIGAGAGDVLRTVREASAAELPNASPP